MEPSGLEPLSPTCNADALPAELWAHIIVIFVISTNLSQNIRIFVAKVDQSERESKGEILNPNNFPIFRQTR